MQTAELSILDFIQTHLKHRALDVLMPFVTRLGDNGLVWLLLTAVLLILPKTRRVGLAVGITLVLNAMVTNVLLKPLVARVRPCDVNRAVLLLIPRPTDFSFPSGHTSAAFSAVSALYFSKNKYWSDALILAVLIAFSRLYLYVHYPSDVLAGAALGVACGWLGAKVAERRQSLGA